METEMTLAEATVIDREIGESTGVWVGRSTIMRIGREAALAKAQEVAARNKKRAGVRALVKKYGQAGASNIVSKHAGRRITVQG